MYRGVYACGAMPHPYRDLRRNLPRDVRRDLRGNVPRDLPCHLRPARVHAGDLRCDLHRNLPCDLRGDLRRNVSRDVRGNLRGDMSRDVPRHMHPCVHARNALRAADVEPAGLSIPVGNLHSRRAVHAVAELPASGGSSRGHGRGGASRLREFHQGRKRSDRLFGRLPDALLHLL